MVMTKEERRAYNKAIRDKPENKAKKKEKMKADYEKNKEKLKAKVKAYREENKEKLKAIRDEPENKAKWKAKAKAKSQTPEGIKYDKIAGWKSKKIISNDWDATFDWVMNTKNCENCDVLLENGKGSKGRCLDHDHSITDRPNTRAVLCMPCNIHEGKKRHASKEESYAYHNEEIKCDCGSTTSRKHMNRHKKTAKHINFHIN
tara:strand:- start:46 stop:654 length:609 start_codon:yes stop_codon:yes gene_type:complete